MSGRELRRPGHVVVRTPLFALRFNWRVLTFALIALGLATVLALWSMTFGSFPISVGDVAAAAFGQGSPQHEFIVRELRLPRILAALLIGAALAMSGALFQGLVRNELASPDIIGINTGAAAVGFTWLLLTRDQGALPTALFAGAMGVAAAIYLLSWKGGIATNRLILVGIGLQAMLVAIETFLVRRFPMEDIIWADDLLLGSVDKVDWGDVRLLAVGMAVLVPCALFAAWPLRVLQLGDDVARTVGLPVEVVRFLLMALGCWLSALAISVAGLIGFVALMVPHLARMIAGPMSGSVMLFTGVLGAIALLGADVVAAYLLPGDLPVSVVMGAIGAPYFLFLFWRTGVRL